MKMARAIALLVAAAAAIPLPGQTGVTEADNSVVFPTIATGFRNVVDLQHAGDGSGRLFVVEQRGVIRIFLPREARTLTTPFLDIQDRVRSGGELGLLGLAFPPNFASKGYFYVNYTRGTRAETVVSRFRVSTGNSNTALANSEEILLTVPQPFDNHNGGQIAFGPNDGFLYIGMGDGGSGGDPQNLAQDPQSLHGKMLRIDTEGNTRPYGIPASNPFRNNPAYRPEIWAVGLRNPWRWAFDRLTGDMYLADVGQSAREEVSFEPAGSPGGLNYGWRLREGTLCFNPSSNCPSAGLTAPVFEYPRSLGISITGGRVYRGQQHRAAFDGAYFFADFISSNTWTLRRINGVWTARLVARPGISFSCFGEDEAGELYTTHYSNGTLHRVAPASAAPVFTAAGAVNAASFQPGLVAGSIATLFGTGIANTAGITRATQLPLPSTLDRVSVTMDGVLAPIFAVADASGQQQINIQVPRELAGRQEAAVVITNDGFASQRVTVPLRPVAPAIFTDSNGNAAVTLPVGQALISAGSVITIYATGLRMAANAPANGAAAPSTPLVLTADAVTVTVGGRAILADFAGLAPGFVGLQQINFRVPDLAPGTYDVTITAAGSTSPVVRLPISR